MCLFASKGGGRKRERRYQMIVVQQHSPLFLLLFRSHHPRPPQHHICCVLLCLLGVYVSLLLPFLDLVCTLTSITSSLPSLSFHGTFSLPSAEFPCLRKLFPSLSARRRRKQSLSSRSMVRPFGRHCRWCARPYCSQLSWTHLRTYVRMRARYKERVFL